MSRTRFARRVALVTLGILALAGCAGLETALRNGHAAEQAYHAGLARYAARDYAAAVPRFERALQLDDTFDDARAYLAWSDYMLGRYAEATREFRLGIERQPTWAGLHAGLGWSRYRTGRHRIAVDAFRQALALAPDYRDAQLGLAYALFAGERYAEARPLLATLVRDGEPAMFRPALGDVEEIRARYAWTLFHLGDFAGARAQFRQGLAAHPDWAGLHNGLGWASLRLGERSVATASFRQALALRPDLDDARQGLTLASR